MDLLDIVLHYDCNLKCTYCTCAGSRRQQPGLSGAVACQHIDRAARAGCTALSLTGGEPTLRSDLLGLIRYARDRGFRDIKVQTNGLVFAEPANLSRACEAGLTRVGLSVHGHTGGQGADYARITRSDAATHTLFLKAVENLVQSGVHLAADLIVMRETVAGLRDGLSDLHARGIDTFRLWLVSLTDDNRDNVETLLAMSESLPAVRACLDYGRERGIQVESLHIPRCLLPGYEAQVAHPGVGLDVHVVTPEAFFQLSESRLSGGHKPAACRQCVYDADCPGLRPDYVERFGDAALSPIQG